MTEASTAQYHAKREQKERELAATANDPAVRAIHLALADRHAELKHKNAPRVRLPISQAR